jgi:predicted MFS family arabinose efflux permease
LLYELPMEEAHLSKIRWSVWNLNAVNFFLAQIADVVVPFLTVFLKQHDWRYDQIGTALAISTFGSVIFQLPAGAICGRIRWPRYMLAAWAIILGSCYYMIPILVDYKIPVTGILFLSGIAGTFFAPLLGTLALLLVGAEHLDWIVGRNRSWNHAGNVAAAIVTLLVVRNYGMESLFYVAALASGIAASCCLLIRRKHLKFKKPGKKEDVFSWTMFKDMFQVLKKRQILIVLTSVGFFYFANGPVNSLVALYIKELGGSDSEVAWIALISQPIMIPSAWFAGKYCAQFGRKPVMAIAFFLLPIRIFLYCFAKSALAVLAITAMDGVIAGVFGVMAILLSADLTKNERGFNALLALFCTMPAIGAMFGTLLQGYLTEHYGFGWTFAFFACVAAGAAVFFALFVKESQNAKPAGA